MDKLEWNSSLSVGDAQTDNQHNTFIHMINDVIDLGLKGHNKSDVALKLMDLMRYADVHFQTEELKMARGKYPCYVPLYMSPKRLICTNLI
jgi:hemerythrin-like metal-binding protein